MITVAIPVGPRPEHRRYLKEALDSVRGQGLRAAEILIVSDMADVTQAEVGADVRIWQSPWHLGVAHAFNFGVALAKHDLVVMMGADDTLQPWAIKDCWAAWEKHRDELGYYYMDVKYSTGEEQSLACGAAMVHKALWRHTGGFPVEAAVGASDTILISVMLAQRGRAGRLYRVESSRPPYLYRQHAETDTRARGAHFFNAIAHVREYYTNNWTPPTWSRKA